MTNFIEDNKMENFVDTEKNVCLNVYKRLPVCFVKGEGTYLWDDKGKKYLDFLTGISVGVLGHCNKKVNDAIKTQIDNLLHVSNIFYNEPQIALAKKLVELYDGDGSAKVFFANSGAEANECAIKLARKFGNSDDRKRFEIITFKNSFHGRTMATLTATGQKKFHDGFEPLVAGFKYADFNDMNSVKNLFTNKTVAVILEVIQGEGGVCIADEKFVKEVAEFCKSNDLIFIVDEIQTGMGRTGKFFGYEHFGVKPDVVTLAKAIGGGLPLGACIVSEKYTDVLTYGNHGSTFGGNIVACSAGLAVVKQLDEKLLNYISDTGNYFMLELKKLKAKYNFIKAVRGKGLIIGMELDFDAADIVLEGLKNGFVINAVQGKVLRFLPSYFIEKSQIDEVIKFLDVEFGKI